MDQDKRYIEELVVKLRRGTISPEEFQELRSWYTQQDDENVQIESDSPVTEEEVKKRMLDGLLVKMREADVPVRRWGTAMRISWLWRAAAVFVLFGLVWLALSPRFAKQSDEPMVAQSPSDSIVPGGNKAILLADGKQVILDTNQDGISMEGGVHYTDGGQLKETADIHRAERLQVYVPKGGIYQVNLEDGTKVWLNADTRLTYPSKFAGDQRVVEVDGEAFFDVNRAYDHDNRRIPFIVKTKNQEIEVVGTQFNVNSYATQTVAKTTLTEGRVQVSVAHKKIVLHPGQQARFNGKSITVSHVDPKQFSAWKEGKFSFEGRSFAEIMDDVGRWYDLTIDYKSAVPTVELVGDAYRNERINLVLRLLDVSGVRYKLDVPTRKLVIY